ncbi:MAG: OmpH family outer membrane protein [Flavobacteriales bacterium]
MRKLIIPILTVLLSGLTAFLVVRSSPRTVALVNLETAFQQFDMTKELQAQFERETVRERRMLDSLKFELASIQQQWDQQRGNERVYDELNQAMGLTQAQESRVVSLMEKRKQELDEQIHVQLSQYLNEFGKAANTDILIGVMNDGTILYNSTYSDMTTQAIEFVNARYKDK